MLNVMIMRLSDCVTLSLPISPHQHGNWGHLHWRIFTTFGLETNIVLISSIAISHRTNISDME